LNANAENFLEFTKEWAFGQDLENLTFWLFAFCFVIITLTELEFLKSLWGLGTEEE
jgi:hypothetical protein